MKYIGVYYSQTMKTLKISRGLEVSLDDEDYERLAAVKVNYRSKPLRWQATKSNDEKVVWYASKTINYQKWRMHRYIFHLRGIGIEGKEIDHKDGNGLNNRFSNLRIATSGQNKTNRDARSDSKSGYKGVYQIPTGRWSATGVVNGRKRHLGMFDTPEEAALAYNIAAIAEWGPYARLNTLTKHRQV